MSNFKVKENLDLSASNNSGLSTQGKNALPISGFIIPFIGPTNKIPSGWILCDGSNGTPDLRNVYTAGNPNVAVGTQFGADTHTHSLSVTQNTDSGAPSTHSHNWNLGIAGAAPNHAHNWGGNRNGGIGSDVNANYVSGSQANISDNNHSHANNSIPLYSIATNNDAHTHNHGAGTNTSGASSSAAHTHALTGTVSNQTVSATSGSVTNKDYVSTFYVNFIMKV